jgi:D-glycero-D-manno-heptose 1,7-bisphosphate phosphatase
VKESMEFNGALFCDRDGILIEALKIDGRPKSIQTFSDIRYCVGVETGLERIRQKMPVFMITNQPEVSRGGISREMVDSINLEIAQKLRLTAVLMCPHDDKDECNCRKPKAGLLKQAAEEYKIDLKQSFLVGDRWRDISCAHAGGLKAFFIDRNYDEPYPDPPFVSVKDMEEVADQLLLKAE